MRKLTETRRLRNQLDTLWAIIIKQRADYKCEKSGKTTYLNSHHIFSRSNMSVRWDLDNGICLNAGWHTLKTESVHKSPIEFIEWLKDERGIEWYNRLRLKANQIKKWTTEEMKEKIKEFKGMIEECQSS